MNDFHAIPDPLYPPFHCLRREHIASFAAGRR